MVTFIIITTTAIPKRIHQLGKGSTFIPTWKTWKYLKGTIKIAVSIPFPENIENPKQHALTWLQSKWEIPYNKTGAYVSEYNLRFINHVEPFPEIFIRAIRENYMEVFNNHHLFHVINLCCALFIYRSTLITVDRHYIHFSQF